MPNVLRAVLCGLAAQVVATHGFQLNGRDGRIDLSDNLAYRSPSLHPKLSVLEVGLDDVHKRMDVERSAMQKRQSIINPFANGTNPTNDVYRGELSFPYGVASGDPLNTSIVLWTLPVKVDDEGLYGGNSYPPVCLTCTS